MTHTSTKAGHYTLTKNDARKPTSANRAALYPICSPDRWGLRFSDADPDPIRRKQGLLAYPVAHDYAKCMEPLLTQIQWGNAYYGPEGSTPRLRLRWPLDVNGQYDRLEDLLRPIISQALTARSPNGGGIPAAAVPKTITLITSQKVADEQGQFSDQDWSLVLVLNDLKALFDLPAASTEAGARYEELKILKGFADTIYHEARHCQQTFWVYALAQQHPDNFPGTQISQWPAAVTARHSDGIAAAALAAKTPIPNEAPMLAGIKRMAIAKYVYVLNWWRQNKATYHPRYLPDDAALQKEYAMAYAMAVDWLQHVGDGGTPIDIDGMVAEPNLCAVAYKARPWENDAFFCGDMASAYWEAEEGHALYTHGIDQCSNGYDFDYTHPGPGRNPDGTAKPTNDGGSQ